MLRPTFSPALAFACLLLAAPTLSNAAGATRIARDEELVFYPALAYTTDSGKTWSVEVQGCVYEPEKRAVALAVLKQSLQRVGVSLTEENVRQLKSQARLFMVDNERGRQVFVRIGEKTYAAGKTGPNGLFTETIRIPGHTMTNFAGFASGRIPFSAELRENSDREFRGEITLLHDTRTIVVSDIDDTIKITQVTNRQQMLRNTLLEPFRPVPGMADVYARWARSPAVAFCYVSASPWQLFLPLSEFVRSNGYPAGPFFLKQVRFKDTSVLRLFDSPEQFKPGVIEPLIRRFPDSRFVLVGDSGERDPEIYATLARQHPNRIAHIYIRDVTGEGQARERYRKAFAKVPDAHWTVFDNPANLPATPIPEER